MFRGLKCTAGHAQGLSPTNAVHLLRAVRARLAKTRRREHRSPAAFLFGALSGVLRAMQGGAPAVLPWPGGGGGAPAGGRRSTGRHERSCVRAAGHCRAARGTLGRMRRGCAERRKNGVRTT